MNNRYVEVQTLHEELTREAPCYADYEELAFMPDDLQERVLKMVRQFAGDDPEDLQELFLYHLAHVAAANNEYQGSLSDEELGTLADAVYYTVRSLMTTDSFVRSGRL